MKTSPYEWLPPSVEELRKAMPQYEVTAFVARGGMGAVYKGVQRALKRSVAIKVLPPEIERGDVDYAERFKREAQAMARLSHPGIVAVHDAGETPSGLLYFVMEFIEGTDVAQLIAREGKLEPTRALKITADVLDALAFAHESGIIHRDIKPSNIMLDARDRVKVADFGLAKVITQDDAGFTRSDLALGTADFIAPEALIPGTKLDARADLYAVGVMLYQMLTGKVPRGHFDPPSGVVEQLDPRLDAIVFKAMKTDREKRYASAAEMKAAIEAVAHGSAGTPDRHDQKGVEAMKKSKAERSLRPPFKSRAALLIAAALIIIAAAAFLIFKRPPNQSGAEALKLAAVTSPSAAESASAPYPIPGPDGKVNYPAGVWARMLSRDVETHGLANPDTRHDGPWLRWNNPSYGGPSSQLNVLITPMTNLGVRVRFRGQRVKDEDYPQFILRKGPDTSSPNLHIRDGKLQIRLSKSGYPVLAEVALRESLPVGKEYSAEFYAIGQQLIARVNGQTLTAHLDLPPEAGSFSIYGASWDYFKDAEVINLDGLPEAEALKLAGVPAAPTTTSSAIYPVGKWTAVWPLIKDSLSETLQVRKFRENDGWLEPSTQGGGNLLDLRANARNIAVRATLRSGGDPMFYPQVVLRSTGRAPWKTYALRLDQGGTGARLLFHDDGNSNDSRNERMLEKAKLDKPVVKDSSYTLELAAIGSRLIAKCNGQLIADVEDAALEEGIAGLRSGEPFRDFQIMNLDGLPEAEALKLAGVSSSPVPALPDGPPGFVKELSGHCGWVRDVRMLPDGRRAVSWADRNGVTDINEIILWDLEGGKPLWKKQILEQSGTLGEITVLPSSARVVAFQRSQPAALCFLDLDRGGADRRITLPLRTEFVGARIAAHPDGHRFMMALVPARKQETDPLVLQLWDSVGSAPLGEWSATGCSSVYTLAWLDDHRALVTFEGHGDEGGGDL